MKGSGESPQQRKSYFDIFYEETKGTAAGEPHALRTPTRVVNTTMDRDASSKGDTTTATTVSTAIDNSEASTESGVNTASASVSSARSSSARSSNKKRVRSGEYVGLC